MQRSSRSELIDAADALVALASLVASGLSLIQAVERWEPLVPPDCRSTVADIRRRLALAPHPAAVERLPTGPGSILQPALVAASVADRRSGRSTVTILRSSAEALRRRAGDAADAAAHTAGARTSARLVAGLPLAFLLLVPVAARPQLDVIGTTTIGIGIALIAIGIRWMARLMPSPRKLSPAAQVYRDLSAQVRAGLPLSPALSACAERSPWAALVHSRRAASLGVAWSESLRRTGDPDACTLAAILDSGRRLGGGLVQALERAAEDLSERDRRSFEARLRRAPVLLVIPLVVTILPGFALLTLGPFLRQLLA